MPSVGEVGSNHASNRNDAVDLRASRDMIDARLDALTRDGAAPRLVEAMRHALLAPGKRVRPLITLAVARRHGVLADEALDAACAVECVHTASLIYDDLPCMDDTRLRRGRAATHVAFGESTALLAAIGLLGIAFQAVTASRGLDAATRADLAHVLGLAIGAGGLSGGQFADLDPSRSGAGRADIRRTHALKTGALFAAAAECGAIVARADGGARASMRDFGMAVGTSFQMLDDVVDATATAGSAGKDVRSDGRRATVVGLVGAAAAADEAVTQMEDALDLLGPSRGPDPLSDLLRNLHADLGW